MRGSLATDDKARSEEKSSVVERDRSRRVACGSPPTSTRLTPTLTCLPIHSLAGASINDSHGRQEIGAASYAAMRELACVYRELASLDAFQYASRGGTSEEQRV